MNRAIAIKELRETVGIAAIALLVHAVVIGELIIGSGYWQRNESKAVPFVGDSFSGFYLPLSWALAIALGLRQSVWEHMRGTYLFLLHRPAAWTRIFATKVVCGLGLLGATAALPILAYAGWAALPNTHASPFRWAMTEEVWCGWLTLPVVYLGAFLSGLRTARWAGTRLLPLAGALLGALLFSGSAWFSLAGSAVISFGLLLVVWYVAATQDFG